MPKEIFTGREQIFSEVPEITRENVTKVLDDTFVTHLKNKGDIEYLYKYYKGKQPIFNRTKKVRENINNHVCENHANEIVAFKTGYICGEPIQYVSRKADSSDEISILNEKMLEISKASLDKELVEWTMICGTGYRIVLPSEDGVEIYTLDPRKTYVIYSNDFRHRPMAGVTYVEDKNGNKTTTVYTTDRCYTVINGKIVADQPNTVGKIPIVEYPANTSRLGSFETVITLLDAINNIDSNRVDGVEQFIQSLLICYNCEFPEGTSLNDIAEQGLIYLKSVGENKADVKMIAEQLNQGETQTLKNDLYKAVLTICGVPSFGDGNTSDSSNNGAVILKNGWQTAEARAKDYELIFKKSEQEMLKSVLYILNSFGIVTIDINDIDYRFTRRNYEDVYTKCQVLTQMLGSEKVDPRLAFNACGMFSDPETAYIESMAWYEKNKQAEEDRLKKEEEINNDRPEEPSNSNPNDK